MVMEDWNKIGVRDDSSGFWVKYRDDKNKQEIHISNVGSRFGKGYYVHVYLSNKSFTKQFKTKSRALSYAKTYMRTH